MLGRRPSPGGTAPKGAKKGLPLKLPLHQGHSCPRRACFCPGRWQAMPSEARARSERPRRSRRAWGERGARQEGSGAGAAARVKQGQPRGSTMAAWPQPRCLGRNRSQDTGKAKKKPKPQASFSSYPKGPTSGSSGNKEFEIKPNQKRFSKQSTLSQLMGK